MESEFVFETKGGKCKLILSIFQGSIAIKINLNVT